MMSYCIFIDGRGTKVSRHVGCSGILWLMGLIIVVKWQVRLFHIATLRKISVKVVRTILIFHYRKFFWLLFSVVISSSVAFYVKMVKKTYVKTSVSFPIKFLSSELISNHQRFPRKSKAKGTAKTGWEGGQVRNGFLCLVHSGWIFPLVFSVQGFASPSLMHQIQLHVQ